MAKFRKRTRTVEELDSNEVQITSSRSNIQSVLNSMLAHTAGMDPVLLSILQELTNEVTRIGVKVDPAPISTGKPPDAGTSGKPTIPIDFRYTLTDLNVILSWTLASADYAFYEIREGANWDTADRLLVTNNANAILNPLLYGTHTFLLKALSTLGIYSDETLRVDITIPQILGVSILPLVAANSVTLSWNVPESTFRIDYYIVKRDGVQIALAAGTFFALSEQVGGEHTYGVTPVDIAGNKGLESLIKVVTTGITDYIFFARRISSLNGILVNGIKSEGAIYVCIDTGISYQDHFISHGWASPQDQVNAGYSPWLSPFLTNASYEETFDFGVTIQSVIINVNWVYQLIYGNFTFGFQIQTSADGVAWGPIQSTPSFYTTNVRYVKVKILFNSQDDLSLLKFTELSVSLNVKRENDGGFATAIASDSVGTVVNFIKQFVDVESITVTPVSNTATFAIYEFNDIPFPTSFTVRIYDNAGVRITRDFRWAARGIV